MGDGTLILFTLGEARFGVPMASVREIVRAEAARAGAAAPVGSLGYLDVRGQSLPIVDPRPDLQLAADAPCENVVVIDDERGPFGLLVEQVVGTARVDGLSDVGCAGRGIAGIGELADGLVVVLEPLELGLALAA
ncbi:MAG: chemotaxis protein CheW [Thermoleophilia bacterium]